MGGGDLNLKKSWHPHTIKNQEKVWKAEQAKTQEEKKLHDLRKEIQEEKNREDLKRIGRDSGVLGGSNEGDKKLDWMYKGSSELINREEYLLGRKIDKSFEVLQAEEKEREKQNLVGIKQPLNHVEHECVPFSIRAYKSLQNPEQVDLQRKVMEDPLMLIKQREMETRRKILENPVKLKELHRILKTDEKLRNVSKKLKKSKKSKKSKRKKEIKPSPSFSSSSYCDSDSDLDTKLAKKLKSGLLNKDEASNLGLNFTKLLDAKFEKISQELDKATGKSKKRSKKYKSKTNQSDSSNSPDQGKCISRGSKSISRDSESRSNKCEQERAMSAAKRNFSDNRLGRTFEATKMRDKRNRKSRSVSRTREHSSHYRVKKRGKSREASSTSKRYRYKSKSTERSRSYSRERKKSYRSKSSAGSSSRTQYKHRQINEKSNPAVKCSNKLTDEEKQAKLKEMQSNAAWREEERTEVVRKHRESYAREEANYTAREFDKDFLNKEVKKAMANQTSVGSRIRANLNNIQRTSAAMDSNFARK